MMTQIDPDAAIGKNFTGYEFSAAANQLILMFSDATFICLQVEVDSSDLAVDIDTVPLNVNLFGDRRLLRLGIASENEIKEIRERMQAEVEARRKTERYAIYQRLKSEFESETPDNG